MNSMYNFFRKIGNAITELCKMHDPEDDDIAVLRQGYVINNPITDNRS